MINALGVVGWGVGGIEIEAVVLGESLHPAETECVGVCLEGTVRRHQPRRMLLLTLTKILLVQPVWVGPASNFSAAGAKNPHGSGSRDACQYGAGIGATTGFWPVDEQTLELSAPQPDVRLSTSRWSKRMRVRPACSAIGTARSLLITASSRSIARRVRGRRLRGPGMPHISQDTATVSGVLSRTRRREPSRYRRAWLANCRSAPSRSRRSRPARTRPNVHGMVRAGLLAKAA